MARVAVPGCPRSSRGHASETVRYTLRPYTRPGYLFAIPRGINDRMSRLKVRTHSEFAVDVAVGVSPRQNR